MAKSLAGQAFQLYARALARAPYKTQAATTAALWAVGDMLSQKLEGKQMFGKQQMDWRRTMATALYGGACIGPFGHFWYLNLDKVARLYYKAGSASFITFKVVADTAIFGPLHIGAFFSYMVLFEGGGWQDIRAKLRKDFWPTLAAEVTIWPAFQTFNFMKVPVDYQLLVVNSATGLESTFMCWARAQDDWVAVVLSALKRLADGDGHSSSA